MAQTITIYSPDDAAPTLSPVYPVTRVEAGIYQATVTDAAGYTLVSITGYEPYLETWDAAPVAVDLSQVAKTSDVTDAQNAIIGAMPAPAEPVDLSAVAKTAELATLATSAQAEQILGAIGAGGVATIIEPVTDDDGTPVMDAECWITADDSGTDSGTLVQGPKHSNSSGIITFSVDPGWYWLHARKDGAFNESSVRVEATE